MTPKKKTLLTSVIILVVCLVLVAGGTYALFTGETKLTTHLHSGSLGVTLKRIGLERTMIDHETGFLVTAEPNNEVVDFSEPTERNVFDLVEPPLIVPLCEYTATMQIKNEASTHDMSVGYWVQIIYDGTEKLALGDQLQVEVITQDGAVHVGTVNNHLSVGNKEQPIGVLAVGDYEDFTVRVTFLDLENNNDAQGQRVDFDLIVHAVQIVEDQASSPEQ